MTVNSSRYAIPSPEDSDAPDGPAELLARATILDDRLRYAGATGGKQITAGDQTTASTSFTYLGTNDKVTGLNCGSADDLILVLFEALIWKVGNSFDAAAAIFVDGTQITQPTQSSAPVAAQVNLASTSTKKSILHSSPTSGLRVKDAGASDASFSAGPTLVGIDAADIANPMGVAIIRPGGSSPHEVGIKFKVTSGSDTLHVSDRKLYVWTKEFPGSGV